jgi:L-malate glycosyltransferase
MNILILTYQGSIAGSTYSITYLAKGLAARGHRVYVGCPQGLLLWELLQNTSVHLIPMVFRSKVDWSNICHIRDVIRKYNIDIVNAQASKDRYTSVFAKYLFRLAVKLVHTRRQVAASIGGPFQQIIYYRGTDKIIAVSDGVKASLISKGLPGHHIEVIYNGTPREKYSNISQEKTELLRKKYGLNNEDFVIGCVSRKKRQEQILQALSYVPFPTKTIFVGIGEQMKYGPFIEKLKPLHEVIFIGPLAPDQVLDYYGLFNLKILPSITEGLSQAILEGMALGVPVIATHASGNPEIIKHGENGYTFNDGDIRGLAELIKKVKDDNTNIQRIVDAAKKTALEDFSIEKTISRHEGLFQSLLEGSPHGSRHGR